MVRAAFVLILACLMLSGSGCKKKSRATELLRLRAERARQQQLADAEKDSTSDAKTKVVQASNEVASPPVSSTIASNGQFTNPALESDKSRYKQLTKRSTPDEVLAVFFDLLRAGDRKTATRLLTNVAQLETARANLELEAPGSPSAILQIKAPIFRKDESNVADVETVLNEPKHQTEEVLLTWKMRLQYDGWRICGMTIYMEDSDYFESLSFEDPNDLARVQATVDHGRPAEQISERPAADDLLNR